MKRIAFYSREFRLCKWPEKPTTSKFDDGWNEYYKAVTSAMENGVRFDPQERVMCLIWERSEYITCPNIRDWQPKEGDNWPAPEGAEIEYQYEENDKIGWNPITKANFEFLYQFKPSRNDIRKVAVLRSESVEKKEIKRVWSVGKFNGEEGIMKDGCFVTLTTQDIVDLLNQSIPKE